MIDFCLFLIVTAFMWFCLDTVIFCNGMNKAFCTLYFPVFRMQLTFMVRGGKGTWEGWGGVGYEYCHITGILQYCVLPWYNLCSLLEVKNHLLAVLLCCIHRISPCSMQMLQGSERNTAHHCRKSVMYPKSNPFLWGVRRRRKHHNMQRQKLLQLLFFIFYF